MTTEGVRMITVACVWVKANVDYGVEYPIALRSAVTAHLNMPHQFIVLTDRPQLLPRSMLSLHIEHPIGLPGWWAKLHLFNPALIALGIGRIMYLDLDSIVVGDLDDVAKFDSRFCVVPTAGNFQGRGNLKVVKKYNTSVMCFDADVEWDHLYEDFNLLVARRLWGDQDWLAEQEPDLDIMPAEWFPRISDLQELGGKYREPGPEVKVVLCKKPKNNEVAKLNRWVAEAWGA